MFDEPKAGASLTSIFAKLRAKYPELADEPLLDQAEASASGAEEGPQVAASGEEPDPNAFDADLRTPVELDVEAPAMGESKPQRKAKRKPKMSEMPAPDLTGIDEPSDTNAKY